MSTPKPNRRQHPTLSDVALALATRQKSERSCTVHVERVAKGELRFAFDLTDPDPEYALKTAIASVDVLRSTYPVTDAEVPF